jgi:hypothetical protein
LTLYILGNTLSLNVGGFDARRPTDDQAAIRDGIRKFAGAEPASGYLARAKPSEFPWELRRCGSSLGASGLPAGQAADV